MIYTNHNHPDASYRKDQEQLYIGYWKNKNYPNLPDPKKYIDNRWNDHRKDNVVRYLKSGEKVSYYLGWSTCRICGCQNGSSELTDGAFVWPEGLAHYIEEHNVKPPELFIKYIMGP